MSENLPPSPLDPLSLAFWKLRELLARYVNGEPIPPIDLLNPEPPALSRLGEKFGLSVFERSILLLCAGMELEPNLRSPDGENRKLNATLGLALSILPGAERSVLSPQNPLHDWQLVHLEPGLYLTDSPLRIDRSVLCYLLDEPALDARLADRVVPVFSDGEALPPSYLAIARQIADLWSVPDGDRPLPIIALTGPDPIANRSIAAAACELLGVQLFCLPVTVLPAEIGELKQLQRGWERSAILGDRVLLLDGSLEYSIEPHRQAAISLFLETLTTPVIFSARDTGPALSRPPVSIEVPRPAHEEQTALWRSLLGELAADLDGHIDVLAHQFPLSGAAIATVRAQFQRQTPIEGAGESDRPSPIETRLWNLCRRQARPQLDDLARRVETTATWEDLILPDRQRQVLEDIAVHLKYRAKVYRGWGFAEKGDRGTGIAALFHGESGTGKTMAACVLARECDLDLYRVDLSTVVSKYIGETEKNLRRIFDAAESGGAILLFDEADALFGKRTEIKDSHDRHANIEVSYLLQRMETYRGLAILTSNLKNNLDEAFARRLRFIVSFPFPDASARAEIWRRVFPSATPTRGLDYDKLGQLAIAGGNIYNIALNAAFLAARDDRPVTMQYILQATQRDYLKLEKLLTREELAGWNSSDS